MKAAISLLALALVAGSSSATKTAPEPTRTAKIVFNKIKVNTSAWDKEAFDLPKLNKTKLAKDLVKMAPNVTAIKGEVKDDIAAKVEGLVDKIDAIEKLAKDELPKPNKTVVLAKLDAFKAAVVETLNATIHSKDKPEPTPAPTAPPPKGAATRPPRTL